MKDKKRNLIVEKNKNIIYVIYQRLWHKDILIDKIIVNEVPNVITWRGYSYYVKNENLGWSESVDYIGRGGQMKELSSGKFYFYEDD